MNKPLESGLVKKILTGTASVSMFLMPLFSGCDEPYYSDDTPRQSVPDHLGTTDPRNLAMAGSLMQHWGQGNNPALTPGQAQAYDLAGRAASSKAQIDATQQGFQQQRQYLQQNTGSSDKIYKLTHNIIFCNDFTGLEDGVLNVQTDVVGRKNIFKKGETLVIYYYIDGLPNFDYEIIGLIQPPNNNSRVMIFKEKTQGKSFYHNIIQSSDNDVSETEVYCRDYGPGEYKMELYFNNELLGKDSFRIIE